VGFGQRTAWKPPRRSRFAFERLIAAGDFNQRRAQDRQGFAQRTCMVLDDPSTSLRSNDRSEQSVLRSMLRALASMRAARVSVAVDVRFV
jgi:hypothetical protein